MDTNFTEANEGSEEITEWWQDYRRLIQLLDSIVLDTLTRVGAAD
jgi:hypothetical protein